MKSNDDFVNFDTIRFIKERFYTKRSILADDMEIILDNIESIINGCRLTFFTDVFVDRHVMDEYINFKSPANWFQHFKKDCFPKWLLKRFPIKWKVEEIRIKFIKDFFPDLPSWHKRMSGICKNDHVGLISREYIDVIRRR